MTLNNFLQGFFADRFFSSLALATIVFMGWLAWMSFKEHRTKKLQRRRYLRKVARYSHA
jgi:hypothetical protein